MNKKMVMIAAGVIVVVILVLVILPKRKAVAPDAQGGAATAAAVATGGKSAQALYEEAGAALKSGDPLKAKESLREISSQYPSFDKIEDVENQLSDISMKVIFSNRPVPESTMHEVQTGDTIGKLAARYGTTADLIRISNNLRGDTIRVGQKLRIWQGKFSVYVDKSQNVLFLKSGEEIIKVYHVSTGSSNSTPVGKFKVVSKLVNPVWFNKGIVVPPDSPQNVLGSRWMGFDLPGYGIHGTIEPQTIGQQVTAGCVRMRNEDVEELYSLLPMGTEVVIVD
ncbi:MAG: L,D-transpeptidase family protein [Candidatus Omnitrophica bacterium]|nr:L,D-transpeptidase family protein [Candidatus Omnitrophota bacterium]